MTITVFRLVYRLQRQIYFAEDVLIVAFCFDFFLINMGVCVWGGGGGNSFKFYVISFFSLMQAATTT